MPKPLKSIMGKQESRPPATTHEYLSLGDRELEDELRSKLNVDKEYPDDIVGPWGVRAHSAPNFRKPTMVVGTDLARKVEALHKMVPETRGRASIVNPQYTSSVVGMMAEQAGAEKKTASDAANAAFAKHALGYPQKLNLQGMMDPDTKQIFAAQGYGNDDDFNTIAHEYQHLMGWGNQTPRADIDAVPYSERAAELTGRMAGELARRKRLK